MITPTPKMPCGRVHRNGLTCDAPPTPSCHFYNKVNGSFQVAHQANFTKSHMPTLVGHYTVIKKRTQHSMLKIQNLGAKNFTSNKPFRR